ncbi:DUF1194 domain-containing protein [Roseovarius sp. 2305UL8-3]|uniref:DUF1194 domain-containing protein n=1 Tax=Roseovarius conchicola TaxID=3121636 RepID=UPI00352803AB
MRLPWIFLWACLALAPAAEAACRQALALGLDVSGSVDATEYRLQLDGLAAALTAPDVQEAFLQFPQAPIRLMIYEWSGMSDQRELIAWREITSADQLGDIANTLRQTASLKIDGPSTAISAALQYGAQALAQHPECWQRTLDISGDGPANIGAHPGALSVDDLGQITVNALVIGPQSRANTTKNLNNVKTLETYFGAFVIRGPGAFIEVATNHVDFANAMKRKLIRELDTPVLSLRGPLPRAH